MGIELDERYQVEAYEQVKRDFAERDKSCIVFPTGCGKSYIALKLIEENPNRPITYVTSSEILIEQIKKTIEETYVKPYQEVFPNLKFRTYNALSRMSTEEKEKMKSDYIILDELHRAGAPVWGKGVQEFLEINKGAKVLGLTATPVRTEGRNMAEEICGGISYELPLTEAVARGILPVPEYICAQYIFEEDIERVEELVEQLEDTDERKAEYRKKIEKARRHLEKADGIEDIMKKHITQGKGKYIVFCRDIADIDLKAEQVGKWFGEVAENIQVSRIASNNDKEENTQEISFFRREPNEGTIQLALAVNMLNEGFHDERLNGVIMARLTMSEIMFRQQLGRALAKGIEHTPQIYDLVNNIRYFENFRREIKEIIERGRRKPGGESKYDESILEKFKIIEEQIDFVEEFKKIEENLRSILEKRPVYEEITEWLESHNGEMPRGSFQKEDKSGRRKAAEEMTEEEKYETNLNARWRRSPEREILEEYAGRSIEEVPEEYREKIARLRELMGKKITSQQIGQATFDATTQECDEAGEALKRTIEQTNENKKKQENV